jgi:hypothetical protein
MGKPEGLSGSQAEAASKVKIVSAAKGSKADYDQPECLSEINPRAARQVEVTLDCLPIPAGRTAWGGFFRGGPETETRARP